MADIEPFTGVNFCCREGTEPTEDRWLEGEVLEEAPRLRLLISDAAAIDLDLEDVLERDRGRDEGEGGRMERVRLRPQAHPVGLTAASREALMRFVQERPATSDEIEAIPLSGGGVRPIPPVPPPNPPTAHCWSKVKWICDPPTSRCF